MHVSLCYVIIQKEDNYTTFRVTHLNILHTLYNKKESGKRKTITKNEIHLFDSQYILYIKSN